jgi:manganese/zinc/iron transport system permease protein
LDSIIINIVLVLILLAISSAITGVFAYLKEDSLSADAIAHSTLPGVCLGFMISGYKSNLHLYTGALVAGLVCQFLISYIFSTTKIKKDTITALVMTTLFALGLILSKYILSSSNYYNKSGLSNFLFGQVASIQKTDLIIVASISLLIFLLIIFLGRGIKTMIFDPIHFQLIGWPKKWIQFAFDLTLTLTVVIGIQAVGVVLMSSLIISPAAIARALSNKFSSMMFLAIVANILCVLLGTYLSYRIQNPTGPWIIILLSIFSFISIPLGLKLLKPKH